MVLVTGECYVVYIINLGLTNLNFHLIQNDCSILISCPNKALWHKWPHKTRKNNYWHLNFFFFQLKTWVFRILLGQFISIISGTNHVSQLFFYIFSSSCTPVSAANQILLPVTGIVKSPVRSSWTSTCRFLCWTSNFSHLLAQWARIWTSSWTKLK